MLVGSLLFYGVIGPILVERGIAAPGYRGIVSWVLWPSTAMMVTSGLLSFALKWRTVLRAFGGLGRLFGGTADHDDPLAHVEVPASWFVAGTLAAGTACVILGHWLFGITWWMGILAVLVTFFLSIVAARATGETDITPIGAMGKITQLIYGVVAPSNITTNLMTASITSGAASHAADLLTDLKSGYLLGGNPRKQTISQLFGVLAGTLVSVPAYLFVVQRDPGRLGTEALPAPSAKVWAGVAALLATGIDALPAGALEAIVVGGLVGILLTLLEEFGPRAWRPWLPSTTGLGIAGVIPAFNSFAMFAGALVAWLFARANPRAAETYTVPGVERPDRRREPDRGGDHPRAGSAPGRRLELTPGSPGSIGCTPLTPRPTRVAARCHRIGIDTSACQDGDLRGGPRQPTPRKFGRSRWPPDGCRLRIPTRLPAASTAASVSAASASSASIMPRAARARASPSSTSRGRCPTAAAGETTAAAIDSGLTAASGTAADRVNGPTATRTSDSMTPRVPSDSARSRPIARTNVPDEQTMSRPSRGQS